MSVDSYLISSLKMQVTLKPPRSDSNRCVINYSLEVQGHYYAPTQSRVVLVCSQSLVISLKNCFEAAQRSFTYNRN